MAAGQRRRPCGTTVPADRRLLRNPPALPAGPLRAGRQRGRRSSRLPARHSRGARRPRRLLRGDRHGRRRRRPTAGHAGRNRAGRQHLGGVLHRSRPGVPPREIHAVRRRNRHRHDHPPAHQPGGARPAFTTNCSAASTCCRRCWACWVSTCRPTSTVCHTRAPCLRRTRKPNRTPCQSATTCTRRRPITTRSTRFGRFAPRNTATSRITRPRPLLDLPLDIEESPSGLAVAPFVEGPRPERELYDLRADPTETTNLLAGDDTERGRDRSRSGCPAA